MLGVGYTYDSVRSTNSSRRPKLVSSPEIGEGGIARPPWECAERELVHLTGRLDVGDAVLVIDEHLWTTGAQCPVNLARV